MSKRRTMEEIKKDFALLYELLSEQPLEQLKENQVHFIESERLRQFVIKEKQKKIEERKVDSGCPHLCVFGPCNCIDSKENALASGNCSLIKDEIDQARSVAQDDGFVLEDVEPTMVNTTEEHQEFIKKNIKGYKPDELRDDIDPLELIGEWGNDF